MSAEYPSARAALADLAAVQDRASAAAMRLSATAHGLRRVSGEPPIVPRRRYGASLAAVLMLAAVVLPLI